MTRLKSFDKKNALKNNVSNKNVWCLFCVLILVVTVVIFRSYANYMISKDDISISNGIVGEYYYEELLNGTDPVLTDNLIPVTIGEDGSVYKANLDSDWYKYEDKRWANAVITRNSYDTLSLKGKVNGATKNDGYVSFDGVDDYIDLGLANYDFGNSITLSTTVIFKSYSSKQQLILGNTEQNGISILLTPGGRIISYVFVEELDEYITILSKEVVDLNKEYQITMTYDGNISKLFINGVLDGQYVQDGVIRISSLPFLIGANPTNNSIHNDFANVDIKQVAIFDRAITEEEIARSFSHDINIYNNEELLVYEDFSEKIYVNDEVIPEDSIESYFVWVPKYSYQLWDLGNYNSYTELDNSKTHAISIRFGTNNTDDGVIGECSTPGVAGSSGNCSVGDYMTHPAFLTFDTNGLWVAKFKVGYDGAAAPIGNIDTTEIEKIIIKPNSYNWKVNNISLIFKNSYDYLRNDESHLMKNTEWGAVAYLSHSLYGTCDENGCEEIRLNNNTGVVSGYSSLEIPSEVWSPESIETNRFELIAAGIDGQYSVNYFNPLSVLSSTTQNYSGIYDMAGGIWELVSGYSINASTVGGGSNITDIYSDFYTNSYWDKYYDKYNSSSNTSFNNRILGDATGELGPFYEMRTSWYQDKSAFINSSNSWFKRGGQASDGLWAGIFSFNPRYSEASVFRIVLVPTK